VETIAISRSQQSAVWASGSSGAATRQGRGGRGGQVLLPGCPDGCLPGGWLPARTPAWLLGLGGTRQSHRLVFK